MKFSIRSGLKHYLQGLLMGGSDIIPGVSGGTMALILGIYRRLITAISHFFSMVVHAISWDRANAHEHWRKGDWGFLVPLALGIGSAVALASTFILHLIETYPAATQGLFFGLVAASIPIPWRRIDDPGLRTVLLAAVFAVVAFVFVGMSSSTATDPSLVRVFGSAAVAICAMILPGVSGAFLLKALGIYEVTLSALRGAAELNTASLLYVGVFIGGMGVGLGIFSQILNWLLKNWHNATMGALVGLMAGALRALWPYLGEDGSSMQLPGPEDPILPVVLLALIGFAVVTALAWWGEKQGELGSESTPTSSDTPTS